MILLYVIPTHNLHLSGDPPVDTTDTSYRCVQIVEIVTSAYLSPLGK